MMRAATPVEAMVEVIQLPVHLGVGAAGDDCQGPEHSTVQNNTVQYSTVQYSTVQYSTWRPS